MKKKNIVRTGLLSAALLLGAGYAVINNRVLTATGTVPVAERDINFKIEAIMGNFANNATINPDGCSATFIFNEFSEENNLGMFEIEFANFEADLNLSVDIQSEFFDENGDKLELTNSSLEIVKFIDANDKTANLNGRVNPFQDAVVEMKLYIDYQEVMQYNSISMVITITASPIFD